MRSWLASLAVMALLTVPAATAVTYPQAGYDAGRTGAVPFDLPRANDTAFELQLPGTPTGTVAVDGRTAYVVTLDHGFELENRSLDENALWSIDLDQAEVTKRFEIFDERPDWSTAFTDGERVYTQVERTVTAYDLDGEELWTWEVPNRLPGAMHVGCFDDPAFHGSRMYLACLEIRERTVQDQEAEEIPQTNLLVAKLDAGTGDEAWVWFQPADRDPNTNFAGESQVPGEGTDALNAEVTVTENRVFVYALAYGRDRAYNVEQPLGFDTGSETYTRRFVLWGLANEDRQFRIYRVTEETLAQGLAPAFEFNTGQEVTLDGKVTATSNRGFLGWALQDDLWSFNPENGRTRWTADLSTAGDLERSGTLATAVRGDTVLAASDRALTRLDDSTTGKAWEDLLSPDEPIAYGTSPLIHDDDTVVAETLWHEEAVLNPVLNRSGYGLRAVDLGTGEVLWDHPLYTTFGTPGSLYVEPPPDLQRQGLWSSSPGFSSDVIVAPRLDGLFEVLGTTAVSMGGPDVDPERFPDVGENVTVDLSDTEPGAFGPATRYRVEWGDGTATPWQADPVFTHAYDEAGNHTVRLIAGNDANQTASSFVTLHVGQTEPNFIETAFKRENQDLTFGVLGIAVALAGGAVGIARRHRERSRLEEELDAIEAGFEEREERPAACEAFLKERKERTRGLVLAGELTEEQSRIVEDRIEELMRGLRLGAVEGDFDFLPYRLVKAAREMLEDGRVSSLERDAFLRALEEDGVLTSQQKALVRERIEAWHGRDAGGDAT